MLVVKCNFMHSDPIADMLTRIRNAQAVKKFDVVFPYSKTKYALALLLEKEGWIEKVEKLSVEKQQHQNSSTKKRRTDFDMLKITIKYEDSRPKIESIKRISKPGCRMYVTKNELPYVRSGFGVAIISTSSGMMTSIQARKQGLGGEVICEIY